MAVFFGVRFGGFLRTIGDGLRGVVAVGGLLGVEGVIGVVGIVVVVVVVGGGVLIGGTIGEV